MSNLLVANRGEIAIRVMRAAAELGIRSVALYSEDDAQALHVYRADEAHALRGGGAAAYLDLDQIVELAKRAGCDAVHPGYGFLSESAEFARACAERGLAFVGPSPETLELLGDKVRARALAAKHGVTVLAGSAGAVTLEEARAFLAGLADGAALILKAVAGGGGRGVRVVRRAEELDEAYARASSEAESAFGSGEVYVEELVPRVRHVEVQVIGDATGAVTHLGERDCSLQRRHQKLVEIAPAPGLSRELRDAVADAAVRLGRAVRYANVGTFEFLVPSDAPDAFAFIEANPRLQVEHTVTEEVTGFDLVQAQLRIAGGSSLAELGVDLDRAAEPRGCAVQLRVNMETMRDDGAALPSSGRLEAFDAPSGRGIRTESLGYAGYAASARFDSLLAKLIAHAPAGGLEDALTRAARALAELRVEGVATNRTFLQALLAHPEVRAGRFYTRFVDDHAGELAAAARSDQPRRYVEPSAAEPLRAGARVDPNDPLAVLVHGQTAARPASARGAPAQRGPEGMLAVESPLQGTIVSIEVREGEAVRAGRPILVMEAMKMEHEVEATASGRVRRISVSVGDTVYQGTPLVYVEPAELDDADVAEREEVDLDEIRPDLREVLDRRARMLDAARPEAVARRRAKGQRTARENVDHLCDPGSFVEYGALALAAQSRRRSLEELIVKSPADGMITGVGNVNGELVGEPDSRCAVMAYDYTVFAGTQGQRNHRKTDRLIDVAERGRMPMVLFAEGGGGRPGDTDGSGGAGDTRTFARFATLSGLVPIVGITSGRCFAGNASLLGCCDVIIATADSNIGMGGPAMVEGGGLGVFTPDEIGGMDVQVPNGVVDVAVDDEAEAVEVARRYLSYFQGRLPGWEAPDQREMRRIVPENRLRVYDVRRVIETLADAGTVLELRREFGVGMITSLLRVEGRPLGVIANNPTHLGGAIDSDGADKAARFMQLCDAHDLPLLYLCDTPGIMVGPEIEKTALVRHSSRMFLIGANLDVPFFTIILRKSYGLGAIAMAGGSFKVPYFAVSWPTGEFGGMGLEGSVKLGYRDELAAIASPEERQRSYERMVERAYERGKALNQATLFGVDDAIDPAESRGWVAGLLRSIRPPPPREGKKRPAIDAW